MKKTNMMIHLPIVRVTTIIRELPRLALGVLACAGVLCSGASNNWAFAVQDQLNILASGGHVEVYSIGDDEYNAYDGALRESDPQKRAAKLFQFIQKYSQSHLVKRISNEDYKNIKMIEDEYDAFYSAKKEPDFEKRAAMLLGFHQKYPQSTLLEYLYNEYVDMLKKTLQDKKYELLESLGEKWLTVHPNDAGMCAFVAEAALPLHKYQRCGECLEAVYKIKPSSTLAGEIQICYRKADNSAKQFEWDEKLFKMPEFEDDYMLRFDLVMRYSKDNNLAKAAEYARLTLKAADLAGQSDAKTPEHLRKVRRACHHIIASDLMEKRNFAEAISEYKEAIKHERYGEGYYGIGLCLENLKEIEEANVYYAMAELMGGEIALKAKARLKTLYRALHNNTLIGINKVYQKAKESLEGSAT